MNADVVIDCMARLIEDTQRKVFLVLDNLRVHHARKVKEWLAEREDEIEVFHLPRVLPGIEPR